MYRASGRRSFARVVGISQADGPQECRVRHQRGRARRREGKYPHPRSLHRSQPSRLASSACLGHVTTWLQLWADPPHTHTPSYLPPIVPCILQLAATWSNKGAVDVWSTASHNACIVRSSQRLCTSLGHCGSFKGEKELSLLMWHKAVACAL